jgi:hypothetical protein
MRVGLGILPRQIFADELVEDIAGHVGLHALVALRPAVIEIKLRVEDVGNQIRLRIARPRNGSGAMSSFGLK